MKFKAARIRNFKLLRDLMLGFSADPERPLTVIRAENGSGKTSTLYALQWGLFGERGLDESARGVRLSPSDWPDGERCEIEVRIDFTHTVFDEVAGEFVPTATDYRIVRTVAETPNGDRFSREAEKVHLFELTDAGSSLVMGPEIKIAEMLPIEMKDVFFTDGDRAMNFISPSLTKKTKQHQVREAIRSLLGLGVLESALDHIQKAASKFNRQLADESGSTEAATIHQALEEKREALASHQARVEDLERQIENLAKLEDEADRRLLQAVKGVEDHAELGKKFEYAKQRLSEAETMEQQLKRQHQELLASEELSWALLGGRLTEGLAILSGLADRGVIPSTSVPVLQDRLELQRCICGQDLSPGSAARANVESLIETQRAIDQEKEALTALYHRAKSLVYEHQAAAEGGGGWAVRFQQLSKSRLSNRRLLEGLKDEIKVYEGKIAGIDERVVEELRAQRDAYRADRSRKEEDRQEAELERRRTEEAVTELEKKWEQIKAANQKQRTVQKRITVSQDLASVIRGTLNELQTFYLHRVSDRMNDLFLQMVGADPKAAGGVFRKAEITRDYEIRVFSADDRTLDPDHELNGASKHALTLAFIWALTEVSGVTAPRVIDTPLGMMSGGVKRRVVEIISTPAAAQPSGNAAASTAADRQVVLFLTRQELLMVEDLIDRRAGMIFTLSNTASFPVDLVNDPGVEKPEIRMCACTHRQHCQICARKDDDQYELTERPTGTKGEAA